MHDDVDYKLTSLIICLVVSNLLNKVLQPNSQHWLNKSFTPFSAITPHVS